MDVTNERSNSRNWTRDDDTETESEGVAESESGEESESLDEPQLTEHDPGQAATIHDEYATIRNEMKPMSLGELLKLQERLGTKTFEEIYHGRTTAGQDNTQKQGHGKKDKKRKYQPEKPIVHKDNLWFLHRMKLNAANERKPTEISSKRQMGRYRNVVQVQKRKGRDPRFDTATGEYDNEIFMKNYEFLKRIRSREKQGLEKEYKNEADQEKKKQFRSQLRRMEREEKNETKKKARLVKSKDIKKKEKEMVKQGKKPFFVKKSEQKNLELADEYKKLKESGRLESYMKTKRKKNAQKQRTKIPD